MIFRRIKAHIEKENWFAVFIDFTIVVVGVFIGIQVANWNAARVTAEEAITTRSSLIADLKNDKDVYEVRRKFYVEVEAAGRRAEAVLASDMPSTPEAQWAFIYDASNAGATWPFKPSGQVYDQLLNSGKLGLIGTAPIQRQMRDYYQDAALEIGKTFKFDSAYRYSSRRLMPSALNDHEDEVCSNFIGADPSNVLNQSQTYMPPCPAPDLPMELAKTAERLHNDPALLGDLRLNLNQVSSILWFIEYVDDEADALIAKLESSQ